jgi:hypothetical protein
VAMVAAISSPGEGIAGPAVVTPAAVAVPAGVTAAVAVYDRATGRFTEEHETGLQVRAASVVKLLIALDHLWNLGPTYQVPAADRARLDAMLRSSDDAAASEFWDRNGRAAIITRMVGRLGLVNTAPPPAGYPGFWGYVALSAADTVTIYRYILDSAPAPVRALVMDNLRAANRCAADRYEQYFGIPEAWNKPWAVKQGWSGFGTPPPTICGAVAGPVVADRPASVAGVDLTREALHTTGTVGTDDRSIVVVFTLHPDGTSLLAARNVLSGLTRGLRVPGAVPAPPGLWVPTWGSGVRVRGAADTSAPQVATVPSGGDVRVRCQRQGQLVVVDGYRNDWWAYLPEYGGYMTNIYVRTSGNKIPGVPDC